jgi:hypothetical protein
MLLTKQLPAGIYPQMIVEMTGEDFDGMLNFGAVLIRSKSAGKIVVLDAVQTNGSPCTENVDKYVLNTVFENDFEEILECLSTDDGKYDGYEMVQDCLPLLALDDVEIITCLELLEDVDANKANIERIQSVYLDFSRTEPSVDKTIPVKLLTSEEM